MANPSILKALKESTSTGRWIRVSCPVCFSKTGKMDRRGSLSHNPDTGFFLCWKCGERGFTGERQERDPELIKPRDGALPRGFTPLRDLTSSLGAKPAFEFLRNRGVTEKTWTDSGIGITPDEPFDGRVIVPIEWPDGSIAGAVGRTWVKKAAQPYRYTKDFQRGLLLYNQKRLRGEGRVFVVEGVFDALYLWPNAVALLGKSSEFQEDILSDYCGEIVIVLDGDAYNDAEALAIRLQLAGANARAVKLPPGLDPDEVDRGWLESQ